MSRKSRSLCTLMLDRRLHQFLSQPIIDASLSTRGASLRLMVVDSGAAVIDERPDAAGDIPVAVARAVVGVVEEACVVAFFILDLEGLGRWVEGVVYEALEGGHVGGVEL